jgi:hypothetical protein
MPWLVKAKQRSSPQRKLGVRGLLSGIQPAACGGRKTLIKFFDDEILLLRPPQTAGSIISNILRTPGLRRGLIMVTYGVLAF